MKKEILLSICMLPWIVSSASESAQKEARELGEGVIEQLIKQVQKQPWEDFVQKKERQNSLDPDQMRKDAEETMKGGTLGTIEGTPSPRDIDLQKFIPKNSQSPNLGDHASLENLIPDREKRDSKALPNIMSKLSIFREIKKDLEKDGKGDVRRARIFQGGKFECCDSVLGDALYDCCKSMKGLATSVYLAKCTTEEMALSEMRDEGRCYGVGFYKKKVLGVPREKRRVFCCFSSKLARIFQEEGRKQLRRPWGEAKSPDCQGLSLSEINRINFDKVDLSEMFNDFDQRSDIQSRIEAFREELKESQIGEKNDE